MPWTNYGTDGNVCGGQTDPILTSGQTIYIQITVTGALSSQNIYYEVPGLFGPTVICTTDVTGACTAQFSVTLFFAATGCPTAPQKVANGTTSFDGNEIDHFIFQGDNENCSGTTTTTTTTFVTKSTDTAFTTVPTTVTTTLTDSTATTQTTEVLTTSTATEF